MAQSLRRLKPRNNGLESGAPAISPAYCHALGANCRDRSLADQVITAQTRIPFSTCLSRGHLPPQSGRWCQPL